MSSSSQAFCSCAGVEKRGVEAAGCSTSSADALAVCAASRRELGRVLAVQAHDPPRRAELPEVVGGVVAEGGELALRGGVALRRGVEVDLGVGDVLVAGLGPVGAQDALEVAHPHVVGDEGHVVAVEARLGQLEVARRAGERLRGSKRWSTRAPGGPQALHLEQPAAQQVAPDPARVAAAARDVDAHAQEVLARLGEDLGQAHGALRVARHRVLAARALEEHERLELVGGHARLARRGLDLRAPARDPLRGRARRRPASARRGRAPSRPPRGARTRPCGPRRRRTGRAAASPRGRCGRPAGWGPRSRRRAASGPRARRARRRPRARARAQRRGARCGGDGAPLPG